MKGMSQAVSTPSMPPPVSGSAPSSTSRGRLLDFDPVELLGWIEGDDGVIYSFSSADVIDDQDIAVGAVVSFAPEGETASSVRGVGEDAADHPRALTGELLSYDSATMMGWITVEGGDLYAFTAADVVGDEELAPGQSVAFQGLGERAQAIRALPASSFQLLEGELLSYDAGELRGWITGDDGNLYSFTAGEVVDESELLPEQRVTFSGAGEYATEVRACPTPVARTLEATLQTYDATELVGVIVGTDGELYHFTGADLADDEDIESGRTVRFLARGDRATDIHALPVASLQELGGTLLSYDAADLCGWISGDDGNPYAFSAADLVGDDAIEIGQDVSFLGSGERAREVRPRRAAVPRPLRGTLASYSADDLAGWISGEDREMYRFDASEVLGDAELRVGQAITFVAMGKRATQIAEAMPAPVAAPAVPLRAPIVAQPPPGPTPTPGFESPAPPRSLVPWMMTAASIIALGGGAVLMNRFPLGSSSGKTAVVTPASPESSKATDPPAAQAAPVPSSMEADAVTQIPAPASPVTPSGPVEAAAVTTNPLEGSAPSEPPVAARPADVAAKVAGTSSIAKKKKPAARIPNPSPDTAGPVAWWSASAPGQLNVVYVGRVAEVSAIALMFDGDLRSAASVNEHVRVMYADGRPVGTRWVLGRNPRMAVLRISPGRYEVSVSAGLTDASGRAVKTTQQGSVVVE